jgi:hypothetical protein
MILGASITCFITSLIRNTDGRRKELPYTNAR